ncbi:PA2778 family cysteine peptidase [Psychrosphaera sp. F3M07]|uniref:PA2778 family cysteine peptidase n=1 Tax=Psychrosphaera sp. F3M07 TaxID=2841560 RepID=UPI001C09817B|nr:PA2778 family cysteine peptidase [Psychrosphaera sp. F3M07]MBU2917150.1 PA2778 family cysteine peptidase [Psychrosphaera sp. F3M07]
MNIFYRASLIAGLLLLTACTTTPQTTGLLQNPNSVNNNVHVIANVPFMPQQQFYCGPTTISEVANFYNVDTSPETLAPNLFIPGREGSLQIEMVSAVRQLGLVAYTKKGSLQEILSLVEQNVPIIVLQNNGLSWYPQWHYSVVVGYDLTNQNIKLHTGLDEYKSIPLTLFERTWSRANFWYLAPMPLTLQVSDLNMMNYLSAAQDFIQIGMAQSGITSLHTATELWPENWLPYFLLGNSYIHKNPKLASDIFQQGFEFANESPDYINNYAYSVAISGCKARALELVELGRQRYPDHLELIKTESEIRGLVNTDKNASCSAHAPVL